MEIFRVTKKRYTSSLVASGCEGRWNSKGNQVIYAASSRSLAALENIVHTNEIGLKDNFGTMIIYFPDSTNIKSISKDILPFEWYLTTPTSLSNCQKIGDEWYHNKQSLILKVPSAIINNEYNFIINTIHSDYWSIKIIDTEEFFFDSRIKTTPGY